MMKRDCEINAFTFKKIEVGLSQLNQNLYFGRARMETPGSEPTSINGQSPQGLKRKFTIGKRKYRSCDKKKQKQISCIFGLRHR